MCVKRFFKDDVDIALEEWGDVHDRNPAAAALANHRAHKKARLDVITCFCSTKHIFCTTTIVEIILTHLR